MYSIIRTKKHKSTSSLKSRMTHTYRTRPTPNADPKRFDKNILLFGKKDYATELEIKLKQYEDAGNHIRSDGVLAIEYLLSASPEFFEAGSKQERDKRLSEWCTAQIEFMKEKHGAENILNMYLHLDEKTPHIECFVIPIDSKNKLNCKHFLGGAKKLSLLQSEYATYNKKFDLSRGAEGSNATHTTVKQFYQLINSKSKITNQDVIKAIELDNPTMLDKLNMNGWLEVQQQKILKNVSKLFSSTVYENKLIPAAKKILKESEKMIKEQEKLKYQHEKELEEYKEQLLKQARVLDLVENYKAQAEVLTKENTALKTEVDRLRKIELELYEKIELPKDVNSNLEFYRKKKIE